MKHKILLVFICIWAMVSSSCDRAVEQQPVLLIEQRTNAPESLRKIYSVYPDGTHLQQLLHVPPRKGSPNKKLSHLPLGQRVNPAQTLTIIDCYQEISWHKSKTLGYAYSNLGAIAYSRMQLFGHHRGISWYLTNAINSENTDLWDRFSY